MASASPITVWSPSSSSLCFWRNELRILTMRITRSHTPKLCEPGGLKLQLTQFFCKTTWIRVLFKDVRTFLSSLSALMKLALRMKWHKALIHASVSKELATSRWTALLYCALSFLHYSWSKIVNSNISKWWIIRKIPFLWQICHLLLHCSSIIRATEATFCYDSLHSWVSTWDPVLSPQCGQRVVANTMFKLLMNVLEVESCYMLIFGWIDV